MLVKEKKRKIISKSFYSNDMELLLKISEAKKGKFISFEESYFNGLKKLKF